MSAKLAILHTTTATVEPLKGLAGEILPEAAVLNWVDDSILPELIANGGQSAAVTERVRAYLGFAQRAGADLILCACSSIGEVMDAVRADFRVPVVRIDEAMAEAAVGRAHKIGVAATLSTTLTPTCRLVQAKAQAVGKSAVVETVLIEGAYAALMAGDREAHDRRVLEALSRLVQRVEVVVLAQASMARVLGGLTPQAQEKFLASPRLGMERVRNLLLAQSVRKKDYGPDRD